MKISCAIERRMVGEIGSIAYGLCWLLRVSWHRRASEQARVHAREGPSCGRRAHLGRNGGVSNDLLEHESSVSASAKVPRLPLSSLLSPAAASAS